jgi:YHS domain-containing protein
MKKVLFLLVFLAIGATLIMCSGEQKQEATTEEATTEEATQEATETVVADTALTMCAGGCSMEMEKAKMVSHEIDGETHYFCSEKCKENYMAKKEEGKKEM